MKRGLGPRFGFGFGLELELGSGCRIVELLLKASANQELASEVRISVRLRFEVSFRVRARVSVRVRARVRVTWRCCASVTPRKSRVKGFVLFSFYFRLCFVFFLIFFGLFV